MVAITRRQRKIADAKVSTSEKDRFSNVAANIITDMSKTKTMHERFIKLFELIEFLVRPENKIVFDNSEFLLFKVALYSNCLDYSRHLVLKKDKSFLFSPFV